MAAYVQSASQSHAEEVAARIEPGMVHLNGGSGNPEAPLAVTKYGATGASGVRLLSASSMKQKLRFARPDVCRDRRGYRMNRTQTVKTAVLAIAAGTGVARPAGAQKPHVAFPKDMTGDTKVIVLSKSDLPGGMEATTFMTEIPPGSSTPRH